jgi:hypothetical protein
MQRALKDYDGLHASDHEEGDVSCDICSPKTEWFAGTLYADGCMSINLDQWFDLCPKHAKKVSEMFGVKLEEA